VANRQYGLTIEQADGTVVSYLQSASSANLTFRLSGVSTLDVTFDPASADGQALYSTIATQIPVARLARDGVTVFVGPLSSLDMTVDDSGSISASFTDWVGMWDKWPPKGTYKKQSGTTITNGLLALKTNYWPSGFGGLTINGSVSALASVSRAEQSSVYEMFTAAASAASFDWYVDHANLKLKIADTLGSDKSSTIFFGVGETPGSPTVANCHSARVTYKPPRNAVWVTTGKGKTYTSSDGTSITNYGQTWEKFDTVSNGNAAAMVARRLRENPRQIVEVEADPTVAPAWLTDYFLGDTVGVNIASRALTLNTTLRLHTITVGLDEQLVEVSNGLSAEVV